MYQLYVRHGFNFFSCVPSTVVCKMAFKSASKLFVMVVWGNKHGNSDRHRRPLASGGSVVALVLLNTAGVCVCTNSLDVDLDAILQTTAEGTQEKR